MGSLNTYTNMKYKLNHSINNVGEKNPNVKLTDEEVMLIRTLRGTTRLSMRAIAEAFGCSHTQIVRIVNQKARTNV